MHTVSGLNCSATPISTAWEVQNTNSAPVNTDKHASWAGKIWQTGNYTAIPIAAGAGSGHCQGHPRCAKSLPDYHRVPGPTAARGYEDFRATSVDQGNGDQDSRRPFEAVAPYGIWHASTVDNLLFSTDDAQDPFLHSTSSPCASSDSRKSQQATWWQVKVEAGESWNRIEKRMIRVWHGGCGIVHQKVTAGVSWLKQSFIFWGSFFRGNMYLFSLFSIVLSCANCKLCSTEFFDTGKHTRMMLFEK